MGLLNVNGKLSTGLVSRGSLHIGELVTNSGFEALDFSGDDVDEDLALDEAAKSKLGSVLPMGSVKPVGKAGASTCEENVRIYSLVF